MASSFFFESWTCTFFFHPNLLLQNWKRLAKTNGVSQPNQPKTQLFSNLASIRFKTCFSAHQIDVFPDFTLLALIPSKRFRLFDSLQKYGLKNNVEKLKYYEYNNLKT